MPRLLRVTLRRGLGAFLALAFALSGSSMTVGAMGSARPASGQHGSHHDPRGHSDHLPGNCCAACAIHCAFQVGLTGNSAAAPNSSVTFTDQSAGGTDTAPRPPLRHRLPPAQGPPLILD